MWFSSRQALGCLKVPAYLLYAVLLFGYLFGANYLAVALIRYNSIHFNITLLITLVVPVSYIIFGCLLGLDYLIGQTRQNGTIIPETLLLCQVHLKSCISYPVCI